MSEEEPFWKEKENEDDFVADFGRMAKRKAASVFFVLWNTKNWISLKMKQKRKKKAAPPRAQTYPFHTKKGGRQGNWRKNEFYRQNDLSKFPKKGMGK